MNIHEGNQFAKIARKGSWYAFGSIALKAISFLLLPLYTRYLTPEQYGVLGTLGAAAQLMPYLVSLQLVSAYTRYYYQDRPLGESEVRNLYSSHLWFLCVWGAIATAVGLLISAHFLPELTGSSYWPLVPLALIPPFLNQIALMGAATLEADLETKKVTAIRVVAHFLDLVTIVILLVPLDMGIVAKLSGPAIASIFNLIVFLEIARRGNQIALTFDRRKISRSLKYSIPLIPQSACNWINIASDKLILATYGTIASVGLYTFSVQIAGLLYVVIDATTRVQAAIGMSALVENVELGKQKNAQFVSFYVLTTIPIYMGLAFFSREILMLLMDPKYWDAHQTIWLLAIPFLFGGLYRPFMSVLSFHNRTVLISSAAIVTAGLNAAFNFAFIPEFGQIAAAISTALSGIIYCIWIVVSAQLVDYTKLNYKLLYTCSAAGLLTLTPFLTFEYHPQLSSWSASNPMYYFALKLLLIASYLLLISLSAEVRSAFNRNLPERFKRPVAS